MSRYTVEAAGIKALVERKNIRSIRMYIDPPDGTVRINIPRSITDERVRRFITDHRAWILEKQALCRHRAEEIGSGDKDTFMLWGKKLPLTVIENADRDKAELADGKITVWVGKREVRDLLDELCRGQLQERMTEVCGKWERHLGVSVSQWRTRVMKTRWGSCNTRDRRVCLNVRLAMLPPECLDKVIVHELCHLYESGHGPKFKALMDKYYPEWRDVRRTINELSQVLQ